MRLNPANNHSARSHYQRFAIQAPLGLHRIAEHAFRWVCCTRCFVFAVESVSGVVATMSSWGLISDQGRSLRSPAWFYRYWYFHGFQYVVQWSSGCPDVLALVIRFNHYCNLPTRVNRYQYSLVGSGIRYSSKYAIATMQEIRKSSSVLPVLKYGNTCTGTVACYRGTWVGTDIATLMFQVMCTPSNKTREKSLVCHTLLFNTGIGHKKFVAGKATVLVLGVGSSTNG